MIEARNSAPVPDLVPVRRALLSTYDKRGLADFATTLHTLGISLVSSGGTARHLRAAGLPVEDVSSVTGFPEILNGRVKTLHPKVHGGLLLRRGDMQDEAECSALGISPVDMVVVNLYPFSDAATQEGVTDATAVENIDIGGPAMARAAAKNFAHVAAVTSPSDYAAVSEELKNNHGALPLAMRRRLALTTFEHTANYDRAVAQYLASPTGALPAAYDVRLPLGSAMRYGENPHQAAAFYGDLATACEQLHGKALSYNNLLDADAALALIAEFRHAASTVAILKHTNPCGVASADTLEEAYASAFATDTMSPFGGIVVMNRPCTLVVAEAINKVFTEIIIAPDFEGDALSFLKKKKNRRLVRAADTLRRRWEARHLLGGVLCQERDGPLEDGLAASLQCVTRRAPTKMELSDLDFAWRVVKHVKSNAIVYVKGLRTLGVGAGQMSRIDASEIAVLKARKSGLDLSGSVVASDAFFPFADGLLAATQAGACAAVQPGGSVRDSEVIAAANNHDVAMIFTGKRHFRH